MNGISQARPVAELQCDLIFQIDAADELNVRSAAGRFTTKAASLDILPDGFIVESDDFEDMDLLVQGTAEYGMWLSGQGSDMFTRFRRVNGLYLITELDGPRATLLPEVALERSPLTFMTPRLKKLTTFMTEDMSRRYGLEYLYDPATH